MIDFKSVLDNQELQDFFDALPERIKSQLQLISKNDVNLLKKYTDELQQIIETDDEVLMCKDNDFKIHMAFTTLYRKNAKKIRVQGGTISKWIDRDEKMDWEL